MASMDIDETRMQSEDNKFELSSTESCTVNTNLNDDELELCLSPVPRPDSRNSTSVDEKPTRILKLTSNSLAYFNCQKQSTFSNSVDSDLSPSIKVKTTLYGDITLKGAFLSECATFGDLKNYMRNELSLPFQAEDLLFVCNGKEVKSSMSFHCMQFASGCDKLYAMVRTTANTRIPITFKGDKSALPFGEAEVAFPANARIFYVKRELVSKKVTLLKTGAQRIILGCRVLNDNHLLGDYLLKPKARGLGQSMAVAYLSKQLNVQHEVDITMKCADKSTLKFSFEIAQPIFNIREIMWRQYHVPKDFPLDLSLAVANTGKTTFVDLNPSYTLIDYGVSSDSKSITIRAVASPTEQEEMMMLQEMMAMGPPGIFIGPHGASILTATSISIPTPATATGTSCTRDKEVNTRPIPIQTVTAEASNKKRSKPEQQQQQQRGGGLFGSLKKGFLNRPAKKEVGNVGSSGQDATATTATTLTTSSATATTATTAANTNAITKESGSCGEKDVK